MACFSVESVHFHKVSRHLSGVTEEKTKTSVRIASLCPNPEEQHRHLDRHEYLRSHIVTKFLCIFTYPLQTNPWTIF